MILSTMERLMLQKITVEKIAKVGILDVLSLDVDRSSKEFSSLGVSLHYVHLRINY